MLDFLTGDYEYRDTTANYSHLYGAHQSGQLMLAKPWFGASDNGTPAEITAFVADHFVTHTHASASALYRAGRLPNRFQGLRGRALFDRW